MTISHRNTQGIGSGTTTATGFVIPTGHALNDFLLATFACKPYTAEVTAGTFITDYTALVNRTNGSVANALDVGSLRMQCRYKIHDGSEVAPTGTVNASPSPRMNMMSAFSKTVDGAWDVITETADDNDTTLTAVSCTAASTMDIKAGDMLIFIPAAQTDTTVNSSVVSVPGCTLGTLTLGTATNATTSGNDGMLRLYYVTVTSGTATGPPVYTANVTTSGKSLIMGQFIRLREPTPPAVTDYWGTAA